MAFTNVVQFLTGTMGVDEFSRKEITNVTVGPEVPCVVDSVGVTENYAAMQAGAKADVKIKVRSEEFNSATCIGMDFEGNRYRIIRASRADKGMMVLVGETVSR